jgi:hypothetical protein
MMNRSLYRAAHFSTYEALMVGYVLLPPHTLSLPIGNDIIESVTGGPSSPRAGGTLSPRPYARPTE